MAENVCVLAERTQNAGGDVVVELPSRRTLRPHPFTMGRHSASSVPCRLSQSLVATDHGTRMIDACRRAAAAAKKPPTDQTSYGCAPLMSVVFSENQLRHTAATAIRKKFGLEGDRHAKCQRGGGKIGSAWLGIAPPRMAAVGKGYLALSISLDLVAGMGLKVSLVPYSCLGAFVL